MRTFTSLFTIAFSVFLAVNSAFSQTIVNMPYNTSGGTQTIPCGDRKSVV